VHLLVAGKGTGPAQRRQAETLVRRHGLQGRVTLAGPVRPSIRALAASDALLHLSWHDSFGFVALEAMACGLPVVTTRYAGASELIEHGVSGLIVDPGNERDIIAAIDSLADADSRARMGAAAAAIASRHGEPDNFRRVLGVMDVARNRAPGPVS
jgi:UDP-glucose:(heptosyl)LPS alpha-1,3-glucosyltransferase